MEFSNMKEADKRTEKGVNCIDDGAFNIPWTSVFLFFS